ncbi:putative high-affinity nitrate transporter [Rosa chinensis]|uniref:Putative high-affinity nitrate transporter n=1 Tax=Rosa chinensis TaxID=74649 RepID=A0A2P6P5M2_ROSCH|nr:high-affinity nitrate transporter-activating protein 2.1 [Rosa chinensis]PRQ17194.1 putative high-affinity nitrate transporter [Rosa chinensis]
MALHGLMLLASLLVLLSCLTETAYGGILLSSLPKTLNVSASPHKPDQVNTPGVLLNFVGNIIAGEDKLGVVWSLNNTNFPVGTDAAYKTVNIKLCYAPVSQVGKPGRKTEDDLDKDKTCQIEFYTGPYNASIKWQYYESTLDRHVPHASYFVRAYVNDSAGVLVAYGQSTGPNKDYNIFVVSGSHKRPKMVSIWFSVFVLFFFVA